MSGRLPGVLVVGQTPPPLGGQAVMVANLLAARLPDIRLGHVRMHFSRKLSATGGWGLLKVVHVPAVVGRILLRRVVDRTEVLYYPPSGHGVLPILRDAVIVGLTRPFFRRTVLHFHASGLAASLEQMPGPLRRLVRRALGTPDAAVHIARSAPQEGAALGARRCYVVENGVAEPAGPPPSPQPSGPPVLSFLGLVSEGKGAGRLIQLSGDLRQAGVDHRMRLIGEVTGAYRHELEEQAARAGVADQLEFTGVLQGADKWRALQETTVFCFPSRFHSETSPLVVIEAMALGVPVVASRWRGIPDLVEHGVTGLLVDVEDRDGWVTAVRTLLADPALREQMGRAARERYLQRHTVAVFQEKMGEVFRDVLHG